MKGHMEDGKFHPHTEHKKGVRKSRDQQAKTEGIRLKRFDRTKIQTLIFPPSWSFSKVRSFLKRNNFKSTKVVKEGNRIRARQFPPSDIKRGGDCRTISLGNSSVQAVLCEVPVRKKRDFPEEFSGFENISMIKDKDVREDIFQTLGKFRTLFAQNGMEDNMIWRFLEECVNGQILISLDKKPDHYVNKLGDFYIDDRVGFKGTKKITELKAELKERIRPIVKYDKARFVVGDVVRPDPEGGNVAVRDALEKKPDVKFKIVEMERGLDPHYIGYEMVDVDKKPFKKNWIYAGIDSLAQGDIL